MRLSARQFRQQPPVDGLDSAVRRGRSLRRRRRAVATGAAGTILSTVLAVSLVTSGGTSASLEQVPAGPGLSGSVTPTPTPSRLDGPLPKSLPGPPLPSALPSPSQHVVPATGEPGGPLLQPWHKPVTRQVTTTQYSGTCSDAGLNSDPAARNGWCVSAYKSGDVTGSLVTFLGIQLCRELPQLEDGTLRFAHPHELDVVISQGSKQVWRWSDTQVLDPTPHTFVFQQRYCYRWRTTWNGTTSDGRGLPAGTYDVVATVVATNQSGLTARATTRILP